MRVVPPLDEFEDCHACLALGFETAPVEQLTFERGKETLAHGIGLRTFDPWCGCDRYSRPPGTARIRGVRAHRSILCRDQSTPAATARPE
jgi:hypothetical protein